MLNCPQAFNYKKEIKIRKINQILYVDDTNGEYYIIVI